MQSDHRSGSALPRAGPLSLADPLQTRRRRAAKAARRPPHARNLASDLWFRFLRPTGSQWCSGRQILRPKAPDDVVVQLRPVYRHLPLVVVAEAAVADVLTAAVAISDDIFLAVGRMLARPHPRGRRRHRSRRAGGQRPAAATAQVAVEPTVTPIIATRRDRPPRPPPGPVLSLVCACACSTTRLIGNSGIIIPPTSALPK